MHLWKCCHWTTIADVPVPVHWIKEACLWQASMLVILTRSYSASSGCILLYTRGCHGLVTVMAIFFLSWLVPTNMMPFAMTFHKPLAGSWTWWTWAVVRILCIYAWEQLQLFLGGLYFCQLDFSSFTAHEATTKRPGLVCSPFSCSCASPRSHFIF